MTAGKRLFLIDGHALAYRSYFAFIRNPLINSKGENTSAVFGFSSALLKIIREHQPDYLAVVFDTAKPTFRHKLYPEYKSTRAKMPDPMRQQMPRIHQIVEAMDIPILEREGYEADDVMASLARRAEKKKMDVVLVTGDKDLLQLVTDRVKVLDPKRGGEEEVLYDQEGVRRRFGLEPGQIVDFMSLKGDTSDNVPGVSGIGDKTARKLIQEYGDLESVLEQADQMTSKRVRQGLLEHAGQARLSRDLVRLESGLEMDVSFDQLVLGDFDIPRLVELFRELEFTSLLRQISVEEPDHALNCSLVTGSQELSRLIRTLEKADAMVLDVETTSTDPMEAELVGLAFAVRPGEAFYLPVGHEEGPNLDQEKVLERLRPLLADEKIAKCGHNIKYDRTVLVRHGCPLEGIAFDTMVASYLINPSARRHNLDLVSLEYLGQKKIPLQDLIGKGKAQKSFAQVPQEDAADYAGEDADCTLRLWHLLKDRLHEMDLQDLFDRVEMPLVSVLSEMEMAGVQLDADFLERMSAEMKIELDRLIEEIYRMAGEEFNINSPKQLSHILFDKLELPVIRRTKTGYSTDENVLEELSREHPLPRKLLEYRQLMKLKSTYVDALPRMVNSRTGRIHTSFNQTITATGRLSSSEPNLQNIPIRTEFSKTIRKAFVAPDGHHVILSADYSQIELRIMAHLSGDEALLQAFRQDADVHARTAAAVFGISQEEVTPELRRQAKVVNFGIIYGMSPYGLAKQLEIEPQEASRFIDSYFQIYPQVQQYMERIVQQAEEQGYVTTLLGRRRYLPELRSGQAPVVAFARRTAINTPIQGTAADLIKVAMIRIQQALKEGGLATRMIIQIHDELVFEVPKKELDKVRPLVGSHMEKALELDVPIKVEIGAGRSWYEAH
jgi:DNA polymerase-1